MIFFPNAKINLGLSILDKRSDGFHNIQSLFYPVPLSDVVEFIAADTGVSDEKEICTCFGFPLDDESDNLCIKAYNLLKKDFKLPGIRMSLYKNIPVGSGLGGGSSDGIFMLKALNEYFSLGLTEDQLGEYALQLGSDCPFFIKNKPSLVSGRGEFITPFDPVLKGLHILIVFPGIRIKTGEAYSNLEPPRSGISIESVIQQGVESWKYELVNQFESLVIKLHPEIGRIKERLYDMGALYASLTGSGSAVYGLFREKVVADEISFKFKSWQGTLS